MSHRTFRTILPTVLNTVLRRPPTLLSFSKAVNGLMAVLPLRERQLPYYATIWPFQILFEIASATSSSHIVVAR